VKTYYYVHTGHRIGLDRFRRAVAILQELSCEITLLTSDFRIAQVVKEMGIEKSVGIDVVRNIPHIAQNGDQLIFDSDEANPLMLEDMKQFFSKFFHIPNNSIVVDQKFFEARNKEKTVSMSYFFGDDDYEKDLEKHLDLVEGLDIALGLGFYYFLDYEAMLEKKFQKTFEFEEYDEMIMQSDLLLTCSPQAVLDSLAAGGKPIYLQREDYTHDFDEVFEKLKIPMIKGYDKSQLSTYLKGIDEHKYGQIDKICNNIVQNIKETLIL